MPLLAVVLALSALGAQPGPAALAAAPAVASGSRPATSSTGTLGEALKPSNAEQLALVDFLIQQGAVFYGAWWCPYCFEQKNLFGTEAGRRLPYVECDKDDAGRQRCSSAGVRAYPTWTLKGERREGLQTLEQLKAWSGFRSPTAEPAR
ncbi:MULTISPECIES: hypothetical protein [unclassified Synechococcus]|jgi:thiol-disulfide isomerase/thioredoxin|uniref:hypothetical protein n=1 Tax=unclassified Synechococcus TaxID=2626047 RepID=UPI001E3F8C9E|nr:MULTISPECIES: hypothetical protein [unclassified Synechococcus]